jgi:hypothetical protein
MINSVLKGGQPVRLHLIEVAKNDKAQQAGCCWGRAAADEQSTGGRTEYDA